MATVKIDCELIREVEQFLYKEARLADENRYSEWEALWTDDGVYWVPANSGDIDPEYEMSIIYDHRSRISVRVNQFNSGKRHAAEPEIKIRRVVSNIEILNIDGDEIEVASNAMLFVCSESVNDVWAARNDHTLRRVNGELMLARKKVVLVNIAKPIANMAFLI